jgi:hypothetical protein
VLATHVRAFETKLSQIADQVGSLDGTEGRHQAVSLSIASVMPSTPGRV